MLACSGYLTGERQNYPGSWGLEKTPEKVALPASFYSYFVVLQT
jgi:hypothetical protein